MLSDKSTASLSRFLSLSVVAVLGCIRSQPSPQPWIALTAITNAGLTGQVTVLATVMNSTEKSFWYDAVANSTAPGFFTVEERIDGQWQSRQVDSPGRSPAALDSRSHLQFTFAIPNTVRAVRVVIPMGESPRGEATMVTSGELRLDPH